MSCNRGKPCFRAGVHAISRCVVSEQRGLMGSQGISGRRESARFKDKRIVKIARSIRAMSCAEQVATALYTRLSVGTRTSFGEMPSPCSSREVAIPLNRMLVMQLYIPCPTNSVKLMNFSFIQHCYVVLHSGQAGASSERLGPCATLLNPFYAP